MSNLTNDLRTDFNWDLLESQPTYVLRVMAMSSESLTLFVESLLALGFEPRMASQDLYHPGRHISLHNEDVEKAWEERMVP